jgi:hypothetical protein
VGNDVAIRDVVPKRDIEGDRTGRCTAKLFADLGDGAGIRDAASNDLGNGLCEQRVTIKVKQLEGVGRHAADVATDLDPSSKEGVDVRDTGAKTVAALDLASAALLGEDVLAVFRQLDDLAATPATDVAREHCGTVEKTHNAIIGDKGHRALSVHARHGIDVAVEADEGGLVGLHRHHEVRGWQWIWQRQQFAFLLDKAVTYSASVLRRVWSCRRDFVTKGVESPVALIDTDDLTASEKTVTQVADGAFDPSLLVGFARGANAELHVKSAAEFKEQRVETDSVTVSFKHHDLGIVEKPLSTAAAKMHSRA